MGNHASILLQWAIWSVKLHVGASYWICHDTNHRHGGHGHVFQNRYKSIAYDRDVYFCGVVRYTHLNPFGAELVKTLSKLGRHRWCGHAVLMGRVKHEWQDLDYILLWFGEKEGPARRAYRR
jgi:hypothetical protein